jgi:hypothetical protein
MVWVPEPSPHVVNCATPPANLTMATVSAGIYQGSWFGFGGRLKTAKKSLVLG